MAEHSATHPEPKQRPSLAWTRGRWALLALAALAGGHWYVSRRSATETAARLHGAASQFAACIVDARPPDPSSSDAKRGLEALLLKRLALSRSRTKPLEACAPLAAAVENESKIHADNFYHRSPNEVATIRTIAQRLGAFDYGRSAVELSKKPGDGSESPTLGLIGDTNRLLELTCQVAQAEKAYDVGACPLTGEAARGVPTPRLALEVSLGEPIADYRMAVAASPAPRVIVAARGRRARYGSWVAGAFAQPGGGASWRTLSLLSPDEPPAPSDRSLPRLELLGSEQGLRVSESFATAGRAYTIDAGLTKATLALQVTAEASAKSQASAPEARVVPLRGDAFAWIHAAKGEQAEPSTEIAYFDSQGKPQAASTEAGALLATTSIPPRVFLRHEGVQMLPLTLATKSDAPAPAPLPGDYAVVESRDRCGETSALLARGPGGATLLLYSDSPNPVTKSWKLPEGTRPNLVCGSCAPRILEVTKDRLALRELDGFKITPVDTPVLFNGNAALRAEAACVDRTTLLAYVVGGALLVQRVTPEGSDAPVEVARPGEFGNATQPQLLLLPAAGTQPPGILVFWRRAGGKTRSDNLRIEFAESADLGHTWH
ncbi:MAG: hypothetical protein AB7K71_27795 [Polyangiaceae bacterium]